MDRTIHKYEILGSGLVVMPQGAKVLSIQMQGRNMVVWAEVDKDEYPFDYRFSIFGTGWHIPEGYDGEYLATVQDGSYVWHVYKDKQ